MRFANGVQWTYRTEKPYFKIEGTEGWVYAEYAAQAKLDGRKVSLFRRQAVQSPLELMPARSPDEIRFHVKTDKQDFIDCVKIARRNAGTGRSRPPRHVAGPPGADRHPVGAEATVGPETGTVHRQRRRQRDDRQADPSPLAERHELDATTA